MAEVEFSNAAEADLVEIDEYSLARYGEDTSELYMHGFDEAFARLRDYPLAAPIRPDLGMGIRCLIHRRHRILYRATAKKVLIVRIIHHARDAKTALQSGLE